jgi:phosphate transport system substrate-binding protein
MVRPLVGRASVLSRACALVIALATATSLADVVVPEGHHVEIRGSLAMGAVSRSVAELFMSDHPESVVLVSGGGTYRGLKSVIEGTADMAMGTDVVPEDLAKLASRKQVTLEGHPIFSDAVVVVVSRRNPLSGLSMHDLRAIFSGKIARWADLGVDLGPRPRAHAVVTVDAGRADAAHSAPADAGVQEEEPDIDVVTFAGNSGPYETFKYKVLGDDYVITPRAREVEYGQFQDAIFDHSIGYVGLHQVGSLKALAIDGVVASPESVRSGRYPIARQLSLFVRKPASATVASVLEYFLAKDKGQRMAESLGNVPVQ